MQILLVSGFLGAGKTTFIKELITRTNKRPVIMENEYGANNLDALELQKASTGNDDKEIKILEFMEGCVCCTMKDSFVNSVLAIFSSLSPEYLIIEPTGVGRLSSIIENLKPILGRAVFLLEPIVVLCPETFRSNMKEYPELYRDQIANASRVVFSKCEHTDPDQLKEVTNEILKINPKAKITDRHYSQMDGKWWDSHMETEVDETSLEKKEKLKDPKDVFSQVTVTKAGLQNPGQLVQLLEDCLHGEFGLISRAKGTIWVGSELLRFDLADKMYAITDSPNDGTQCVFIGKGLNEKRIRDRLISTDRHSIF